jgi:hypothetical protein
MKTIRSLLGLVIFVAVIYFGYLLFPPIFANYQLADAMESTARITSVAYPPKTEEDIREIIMKEVRNLDIPLTPEQVKVQRTQEITIWADYTVHIDNPVHPIDLEFHPASKNKKN